jgi:hypothetical protein
MTGIFGPSCFLHVQGERRHLSPQCGIDSCLGLTRVITDFCISVHDADPPPVPAARSQPPRRHRLPARQGRQDYVRHRYTTRLNRSLRVSLPTDFGWRKRRRNGPNRLVQLITFSSSWRIRHAFAITVRSPPSSLRTYTSMSILISGVI